MMKYGFVVFIVINDNDELFPFRCLDYGYKQCVPYNDETKHLIGTTEMPPMKYITWEE